MCVGGGVLKVAVQEFEHCDGDWTYKVHCQTTSHCRRILHGNECKRERKNDAQLATS